METRKFGRTGHMSTVAILGTAAFGKTDQATTDEAMRLALDHGVNHIDIAPSYGHAEERVAPWMKTHRKDFFLGCKTMDRSADGARAELEGSLKRLGMDHFDLYQIHAVKTMVELDEATHPGCALDMMIKARDQGLIRYIGITGHGFDSPAVFLEALNRFDFDSVLFPVNFIQFAEDQYRKDALSLLEKCVENEVGVMMIKSICKGPWGDQPQTYHTWYEPFTGQDAIQSSVNFALSQKATGICTAGDTRLLPKVLKACEKFSPLSESDQVDLIAQSEKYEPLFIREAV
ncbi:MAG: aldo/keto reductase [Chloroflexi bacterium]|nr:aldo/keto reductase [Chloroflexota bacterium]